MKHTHQQMYSLVFRLRAEECDRCTVIEERLKNTQEQNLHLITKLSELNNSFFLSNNVGKDLFVYKNSTINICFILLYLKYTHFTIRRKENTPGEVITYTECNI